MIMSPAQGTAVILAGLLDSASGIVPTFAWRAYTEERLLSHTFGERYAIYRKRTKRIIPYLLSRAGRLCAWEKGAGAYRARKAVMVGAKGRLMKLWLAAAASTMLMAF
jgi:hypothetical protein